MRRLLGEEAAFARSLAGCGGKNPARFVPQYGGWCAWAVAEINKRVEVDPESYAIKDGKLYLFFKDAKLDTRAMWAPKSADMIQKAEANWPALMK